MCPKMTQNMLSVRIPFKHVIAPDGTSVSKTDLTFFRKEKHKSISAHKFPEKIKIGMIHFCKCFMMYYLWVVISSKLDEKVIILITIN